MSVLNPADNLAGIPAMNVATDAVRTSIIAAYEALGELRLIACALHAIGDDNAPIDEETRHTVLCHAATNLHGHIDIIEDSLDFLDDAYAEKLASSPADSE